MVSLVNSLPPRQELVKLWVAHQFSVAAFIGSIVTDFAEAEELLQETAILVFKNTERFDESRPFLPWCLGIARNVISKHRRRKARDRHLFNHDALENLSLAFQELSEREECLSRSLENCHKRLSPRSQEICRLRYVQDLRPQEIAVQLGSTPATVSTALYRIREQLKACIEQQLKAEGLS